MKHNGLNGLFALLLALFLAVPLLGLVQAPAAAATDDSKAQLTYVTDEAKLLSETERTTLEETAAALSKDYQCSVYLVTVADYTTYGAGSVYDCAKQIYTQYALGWGEEQDGVLLLLSMADRDYYLIAHGSFGNAAFTDYGKQELAQAFLDNFKEDDWYGGFSDYLEESGAYMKAAKAGTPIDTNSDPEDEGDAFAFQLGLVIVVPCAIALIVCLFFRRQMKTARKEEGAAVYLAAGGVQLRVQEDSFTHSTVSRVHIDRDNDSGGGGTSVGSDGFSGSGGKF